MKFFLFFVFYNLVYILSKYYSIKNNYKNYKNTFGNNTLNVNRKKDLFNFLYL